MRGSRTSNVLKNSAASLIGRAVSILSQFALRTAFIYLLGKEYTGISGLFSDILKVLSFMELGLDASMVYSLYKPLAENDTGYAAALMRYYKRLFIVIGCAVAAAGCAAAPFIGFIVKDIPDISENITLIFLMYVFVCAFSYFFSYRVMLIKAQQQSRVIYTVRMIFSAAETVAEIILLLVFRRFFAYLITHFVFSLAADITLSVLAGRKFPECLIRTDTELSHEDKKAILKNLLCLTAFNVSGVAINSTDSIFISLFAGTAQVAVIGNFTLIVNAVRSCVEQISNAVSPSVGNLAALSSGEKQEQIFRRMNFLCFYAAVFCSSCLFTLMDPFIGGIWLDDSYRIPVTLAALMTVNFYIAVMVFPVEAFRSANGLFVQGWFRPVCTAAINIALDYFLGKQVGITGILAATAVSRLVTQVWFDPYLLYKLVFPGKLRRYYADYAGKAVFAVLVGAVTYFAAGRIELENAYLQFIGRAAVAVTLPNVLLLVGWGRTPEFLSVCEAGKRLIIRRKKTEKAADRSMEE